MVGMQSRLTAGDVSCDVVEAVLPAFVKIAPKPDRFDLLGGGGLSVQLCVSHGHHGCGRGGRITGTPAEVPQVREDGNRRPRFAQVDEPARECDGGEVAALGQEVAINHALEFREVVGFDPEVFRHTGRF